MKRKHKIGLSSLFLLITVAILSCMSANTIGEVYALASYSPIYGYQGPIGSGITGSNDFVVNNPTISAGTPTIRVDAIESSDASQKLTAKDSLRVPNLLKSHTWEGHTYLKFAEYFTIKRTDGRKIYSSSDTYNSKLDTVNYDATLWVKQTTLSSKKNGGFFWTKQQEKLKNAYYGIVEHRDEDWYITSLTSVHDSDSGSDGINPGNTERELFTLVNNEYDGIYPFYDPCFYEIKFEGTGYWQNETWNNTWDEADIDAILTTRIYASSRDWTNRLYGQDANTISTTLADGTPVIYSCKPFIAISENINNYVKVNGNKVTPNESEGVTAYYDGFHIGITESGITNVSIENGAEETYTDYKCIIDDEMPDFTMSYINTNALEKVTYSAITTDGVGRKTQIIRGAKFADKIQFNFGTSESESPETATYTYEGETHALTSGTWLDKEGDYSITVTDYVGNSRTIYFSIDSTHPTLNFNNVYHDTQYKITKWYKVTPPSTFKDTKIHSYGKYSEALDRAVSVEFDNKVSTMQLDNVEDFIETNIADNGDPNNHNDEVRTGTYWLYKSLSNPNVELYYFDYDYLLQVVKAYCSDYISGPFYYYQNQANDYGEVLDETLYDNIWNKDTEPAIIGNLYKFVSPNEDESYKVYYCYAGDEIETWTEVIYNKRFADQVSQHGLYKIKEIDYVGHETSYNIYIDHQAPVLTATVMNYGSTIEYTKTITEHDVPENSDLVYYFASFNVDEIWDEDTWYVLKIETPSGLVYNYTYEDEIPNLEHFGSGTFKLSLFDRVGNTLNFQVAILGRAPTVDFIELNNNTQLQMIINQGEDYNSVTNIKIYRNQVLLNNDNGYDEYPDKTTDDLIYISVNTFEYVFSKGGIYEVELTDNYGRTLIYEYIFTKDLPTGILLGVKHNGKTNTPVQFIFNNEKYKLAITENEKFFEDYTTELNEESNLTTITIQPKENIYNYYQIKLMNRSDLDTYNNYNFYIKTLPPKITLVGVQEGGTTSSEVYATWEETEDQCTSTFIVNDSQPTKYRRNQVLTSEGHYTIYLSDSLGNTSSVQFELDRTINFTIFENDIEKTIEEIRYTNKPISIRNNEPLTIAIEKDGESYDYKFGEYITSEGTYIVTIKDEYNNTKVFTFTIDVTPPTATLIGVDNHGKTSEFVQVVWEDSDNKAICFYNDNEPTEYFNGENFMYNGKYVVRVLDKAGNYIEFNFTIDNKLEYVVNTFYNGYSNGDVFVMAKEPLTIEMFKDNEQIDYKFEQKLTEYGKYKFVVTDEIGNSETFYFEIIQKPVQKIDATFRETIQIKTIIKEEENYSNENMTANRLYLFEEGIYTVTVTENETDYTFNIEIDTTPPTLVLVGVENGGHTKGEVYTRNVSEKNTTLVLTFNGEIIDYSLGQKLENAGTYNLKVYDEAGNFTEYTFTIVYALNGASIALIAGALAIVVIVIALIVVRRKKFKKAKIEYEVETDLEDDN